MTERCCNCGSSLGSYPGDCAVCLSHLRKRLIEAEARVAEQAKEIAELKEQVMAFAAENAAFRLNEAWRREHGR